MVARLRNEGLLTVGAAENVVRIVPPLIIGEEQVAEALAILDRTSAGWTEAA
jgi:acetylornithine/N-succinyldiaminopimelate aminotransferase